MDNKTLVQNLNKLWSTDKKKIRYLLILAYSAGIIKTGFREWKRIFSFKSNVQYYTGFLKPYQDKDLEPFFILLTLTCEHTLTENQCELLSFFYNELTAS